MEQVAHTLDKHVSPRELDPRDPSGVDSRDYSWEFPNHLHLASIARVSTLVGASFREYERVDRVEIFKPVDGCLIWFHEIRVRNLRPLNFHCLVFPPRLPIRGLEELLQVLQRVRTIGDGILAREVVHVKPLDVCQWHVSNPQAFPRRALLPKQVEDYLLPFLELLQDLQPLPLPPAVLVITGDIKPKGLVLLPHEDLVEQSLLAETERDHFMQSLPGNWE